MKIAKACLAAVVAAAFGQEAVLAADDPPDAVSVHATAYEQIPASATFSLETANDSELTYQVEQLVRSTLQRLGYALSDDSPLVLTVATETTDQGADTPWPVQFGASKSSLQMRLFLLGPNSSGLLQERRGRLAGDYRISLSVHDRRTRGYLWRGTTAACRCGDSALASSRRMVPVLVEAIGRNVGSHHAVSSAWN